MRTAPPILAPIFRSEGQARVLSIVLLGDEERSISQVADLAALAYPTAHHEIRRLLDAGILRERRLGNTRLISANPQSPLVEPLREILLVATGPVVLLSEELGKIDGVRRAFLYGSFAARSRGIPGAAPNDIDLMVIGAPDVQAIYDVSARVEQQVGRPVNPTILTEAEFSEESGFLQGVRANPTIELVGAAP